MSETEGTTGESSGGAGARPQEGRERDEGGDVRPDELIDDATRELRDREPAEGRHEPTDTISGG